MASVSRNLGNCLARGKGRENKLILYKRSLVRVPDQVRLKKQCLEIWEAAVAQWQMREKINEN
jgi:hypothetical protein